MYPEPVERLTRGLEDDKLKSHRRCDTTKEKALIRKKFRELLHGNLFFYEGNWYIKSKESYPPLDWGEFEDENPWRYECVSAGPGPTEAYTFCEVTNDTLVEVEKEKAYRSLEILIEIEEAIKKPP